MCIIVHSKTGEIPDLNLLHTAWKNNPHGLGIMWAENGRVETYHEIPTSFEAVVEAMAMPDGRPWAMHFRWVTRGKLTEKQCHPFEVCSVDTASGDLWMMHNGTMNFMDIECKLTGKSDTQLFAEMLRRTVRRMGPEDGLERILSKQTMEYLRSQVGAFNKLVFLDSLGDFHFINHKAGVTLGKFWFSNTYSFQEGYRDKAEACEALGVNPSKIYVPLPKYNPPIKGVSYVSRGAKIVDKADTKATGKLAVRTRPSKSK